jgi:hypothetical protein
MTLRICANLAALIAAMFAHGAHAQDQEMGLTPAGKAILQRILAVDGRPLYDRPGPTKPMTFPLAMCTFPRGLCGAVRRDGTVAVPPRYDWVGPFSDNRAAVRLGGLYGFVDENGHEIVQPQYRIVDDYKFGFAQVDVDGKSGLIDRDGKMVFAPTYGFISAIGPDRFQVSEHRHIGGIVGGDDFSGIRGLFIPNGGGVISGPIELMNTTSGVIDISGRWIEPPRGPQPPPFDKDDPSLRWVQKDRLWGLARADGSWLVEPTFEHVESLSDGLARVTVHGKVGFIDRTGSFVIRPAFDQVRPFQLGFDRTTAERDGIVGVIDKSGAWMFQTNYQQLNVARTIGHDRDPGTVFGWHFEKNDRWGLLDLDGRVVLDADFDQFIHRCPDGRLEAYKNKEWLYFNGDGSPLQPPNGRLVDASCYGSQPPYTLKIGDTFELVDISLKPLTPLHFDAITSAGPDARNVKIDGKWGRVGSDGHWLLEPRYDYLSHEPDLLVASFDGKRGFMRSDGSWLIEPKFDAAARRDKDTAFVTTAGATGVLRLSDRSWVVPPRPGVMCDISYAIMSQSDGKRAILSPAGETWIDIGAERIGINLDLGLLTFLKDGKWGLVDTAGQIVAEPQFDAPVYFVSGFRGVAWVKRETRWCAIDRRGHDVPGIACTDADPMPSNARFECKVER